MNIANKGEWMYRAIIVDDDLWARADIRASFESLTTSFEVVAEFGSAEDALRWMYSNQVDLVVTDICMNRRSGLEMIRIAKENNIHAIWVILTGYDDFSYIQDAFVNQVFYYMLKPIRNDEMKSVLERACLQLDKERNLQPRSGQNVKRDDISMLMAYINEHYAEEISLEELARMFHIDSSYLSHLFVKRTGVSFSYFRNSVRIQQAKKMLADTQKSVSEIAYEVGYGSVSYFNRVFKEHVGMTPQKFRSK